MYSTPSRWSCSSKTVSYTHLDVYKRQAHCMPFTKESLFYREIFEKYYHDQSRTIVAFWTARPSRTAAWNR